MTALWEVAGCLVRSSSSLAVDAGGQKQSSPEIPAVFGLRFGWRSRGPYRLNRCQRRNEARLCRRHCSVFIGFTSRLFVRQIFQLPVATQKSCNIHHIYITRFLCSIVTTHYTRKCG